MFRNSLMRSSRTILRSPVAVQQRCAHAISNPELAQIEKRWETMPPQEQAELWMSLRDRMKAPWAELTTQEKKASYYIAFGDHGPRALTPPGEGMQVAGMVALGVAASAVLFAIIRYFGGEGPSTMNKEYQEATNEYLKAQNSEPITGISSEGYSGKGQVQSAPKKN
ncbi:hypothetical protein HYALB_00009672 [Hymenoscyphus albidus]|uniref:Cytochrome c oxidase polypeptide V n=1 Tax=Hymenoscyphus albidus TaxID=595503 RepID=A0A9N9Q174_9HELO|nr:hypothetical protein HYALB_00009672 [Hymenoscyphus albidus]